MKLAYKDILSKHKDKPCVVACHGPSLDAHKNKIEELQREKGIIRISMNEWYDFFSEKPDYWILSNSEYTIGASMTNSPLWQHRDYPPNVFNQYKIPLLYNKTADLTGEEFIETNLECDYFAYDTRHFKGHTCLEVFKNFKEYYEIHKDLDFRAYGNNAKMWHMPDVAEFPEWFKQIHGKIGHGWNREGKCCNNIPEITLQEKLQALSGHKQHMSPGHTVGMFGLIFAVLMGCNPVYVGGMDLDYSLGYAAAEYKNYHSPNIGNIGHWKITYKDFLLDDMRILKESAELLGIKIINLNNNAWYDVFEKGSL